ncbi:MULTISPECIES: GNAT family N-acetyltransferase [unclassified Ruegeria]|uniref:GNAT family N-acetyltransferase n=2 Tax=unclassified Ruegeria TaxID=2625375 RepID=UPI001488A669|nr:MULTISPECIES: GNAT family N-acetyltransferase [unclassified Ruegeria]NOD69051.1 GNAT family N-acetyltransferase [Ruegeria sp. HKCCD7303]NOD34999.1 GNAT family N-acetyltransferase [Ruegeria sp. HKCCD7296]NOD47921.1 GNAT family N-acetyltransferase [Ruegeria sp. HKCCD5849]NOD52905.1 GNAT family N-acetyltransferase [Ruegeria sp. HKCCD5851]NOE35252.1 GNAT family N-acetyltransferase [Ruegeria sp. HKCCD7318]
MTPDEMASTHVAAFTQSRPWSASEFESLLENAFTHYVGDARCFALYQVIAGEAELLTIATHPTVQRQGLALQTMRNWHKRAAALHASRAFLDVAADNEPAIALYKRCGYHRCGMRPNYYSRETGLKADALVMECRLP